MYCSHQFRLLCDVACVCSVRAQNMIKIFHSVPLIVFTCKNFSRNLQCDKALDPSVCVSIEVYIFVSSKGKYDTCVRVIILLLFMQQLTQSLEQSNYNHHDEKTGSSLPIRLRSTNSSIMHLPNTAWD